MAKATVIPPGTAERLEWLFEGAADNASTRWARTRASQAVECGWQLLQELAEPWSDQELHGRVSELVLSLHLYARVLDDAIDECLPVNRRALLRAQPMLWQTAADITRLAPCRHELVLELVHQVVRAVERSDAEATVESWGGKNAHLLLAPALLAPSEEQFQLLRPALELSLSLVQAREEVAQGAAIRWMAVDASRCLLPSELEAREAELRGSGCHELAHRLREDAGLLMTLLERLRSSHV